MIDGRPHAHGALSRLRTILAFFLAPLVAPPLFVLSQAPFVAGWLTDGAAFFDLTAFFSLYVLPIAYPATLVLGLPAAVILEKLGRLNLLSLVAVAAAEGAFVILLLFTLRAGAGNLANLEGAGLFHFLATGAFVAAGVAVAAWFISGRYRS